MVNPLVVDEQAKVALVLLQPRVRHLPRLFGGTVPDICICICICLWRDRTPCWRTGWTRLAPSLGESSPSHRLQNGESTPILAPGVAAYTCLANSINSGGAGTGFQQEWHVLGEADPHVWMRQTTLNIHALCTMGTFSHLTLQTSPTPYTSIPKLCKA